MILVIIPTPQLGFWGLGLSVPESFPVRFRRQTWYYNDVGALGPFRGRCHSSYASVFFALDLRYQNGVPLCFFVSIQFSGCRESGKSFRLQASQTFGHREKAHEA